MKGIISGEKMRNSGNIMYMIMRTRSSARIFIQAAILVVIVRQNLKRVYS